MDFLTEEKETIQANFKSKCSQEEDEISISELFLFYKEIFALANIKFFESKLTLEHFFDNESNNQKLIIIAESYFVAKQNLGKYYYLYLPIFLRSRK